MSMYVYDTLKTDILCVDRREYPVWQCVCLCDVAMCLHVYLYSAMASSVVLYARDRC